MSCDAYFEALVLVGDFRGQTLEQVLGRVRFGIPLVIKSKAGETVFDREWPFFANPPVVVGREHMPQFRKGPLIDAGGAMKDCVALIERFSVLTPSETVPAFALSGGNQQKLLVGRELSSEPRVLNAAHPTRGVDIGAQAVIWVEIRHARDAGLAVQLISADLEELIGLSDTILVMFDGEITATLDPAKVTPEILGTHMTGGNVEAA